MLKRVHHDIRVRFLSFCHPEPGPELISGSNDFGISVLGLENLGFKAPLYGRGNLPKYARIPPSSAGGMNGLPSPLGGEGLGEGEMI